MRWRDQHATRARYTVVPRTLSFLVHDGDLLLLRRDAQKEPWPGKLNGLGGHVEAGEDILASARREICEETARDVGNLSLGAIVHVSSASELGVVLFVFVGRISSPDVCGSAEGELEWHPLDHLPWSEMVPDLPRLLPRVLARSEGEAPVYACYKPSSSGEMVFRFREDKAPR